jgi:branched-chain amino acid transport system substrate-binding protein
MARLRGSPTTTFDAVGDKLNGMISRASFSLDLASKRPSVGKVNDMFKARANRDLNDNTSRQLTAVLVLADAIDQARSTDGEKVRAALAATDTPGEKTIMPWKRISSLPKMERRCRSGAAAVSRRQFVTVYPAQAAIAEPKWPMNG